MRTHVLLMIVSAALLGFAPAPLPKKDRHREDPADVGGTWEYVSVEMSGNPDIHTKAQYLIEMTRAEFAFVPKAGGRSVYVMKLDPTASPPAFTWSMNNTVMFVGSYRLQRDQISMIFRYGKDVALRPTDFAGKPEYHYVLRRIKR